MLKMRTTKTCRCCNAGHAYVPAAHRFDAKTETYYFECSGRAGCSCGAFCKSTLSYQPDQERTARLITEQFERDKK